MVCSRRVVSSFTVLVSLLILCANAAVAQGTNEVLGPKDGPAQKGGKNPLAELMVTLDSQLRPELMGKHPRVYFTAAELDSLRDRARTTHKDVWARAMTDVRALKGDPPPPPAEARRAQNDVAYAIAQAAFIYRMEGDKKYLNAAKKYMDAAVGYDVWGYAFNKPNVDLAAGHLLYGMSVGYDLLYDDLTPAERTRYRGKIAKQAQLMFDYFRPKAGRTIPYSQNHVFIPVAGLGIAAYALYDEVPEAPQWAALARAIYDRVLATYSTDGYYYEGFEYWVFSTPWIIHYLDAHKHATGEDLFDQPGLKQMYLYAAHVLTPGGQTMFDFGDVFEGPITRAKQGDEYERSHPGGKLHSNYNILFDLASRYRSSDTQGVAMWMQSLGHVNQEDWWSLAWYDANLPATPIQKLEPWHYFADQDVVFWRTDWTADATAVAFKCGPPEGHHTAEMLKKFPDWRLSSGHSHPDANSFIIWAHGEYLTGDSGYAGVPKTEHHNTLLVDGKGQGNEGKGHDAWDGFPYDRLNQVRIREVQLDKGLVYVEGDAVGAYAASMGLTRFTRHFLMTSPKQITVWDDVQSDKPHTFTGLLHSDTTFAKVKERRYQIGSGPVTLTVDIPMPKSATSQIVPNIVMAPGKPGSVDKGEEQRRGDRLAVSTSGSVNAATFVWQMKIGAAEANKGGLQ